MHPPGGVTIIQPKAPCPFTPAAATATWRDEVTFTLTSGQGVEIKLKMQEGDKAQYAWRVTGGVVNFDTHGDAPGRWFWRNRGQADVSVVLQTRGQYSEVKRMP